MCSAERRPEGNQLGGVGEVEQRPPAAAPSGESAHRGWDTLGPGSRQRLPAPREIQTSRLPKSVTIAALFSLGCVSGRITRGRTRPICQACENQPEPTMAEQRLPVPRLRGVTREQFLEHLYPQVRSPVAGSQRRHLPERPATADCRCSQLAAGGQGGRDP